MTRLLVLGGGGMLGHKLMQRAAPHIPTFATVRTASGAVQEIARDAGASLIPGIEADAASVERVISAVKPTVVVNCVGVIKQRAASHDAVESIRVNSLFPHEVGRLAEAAGAWSIHLSTDCVFSGKKGNYVETDVPDAQDLYGRSKLLGENVAGNALTIRTSMIGRELSGFWSLIEWFLRQPPSAPVRGFTRAIFSGLTTIALADEMIRLATTRPALHGVYHVSADPISKYDLLRLVNRAYGLDRTIEEEREFHCDRSLVSERYRAATGFRPDPWPAMVAAMAADATPYATLAAD